MNVFICGEWNYQPGYDYLRDNGPFFAYFNYISKELFCKVFFWNFDNFTFRVDKTLESNYLN